ncbi:MAG TPA: PTS sugar transporter subunit IIA [Actinomycetota bacterium]|nr:PTS sugar transporter subunit IIA [Actinomycetota bacterium]
MTTIEELTSPSLVSVSLAATERRAAIEELAKLLEADGRVGDVPAYVDAVWAREQETGGTGMESGIAIPHAKSPAVLRASVAFGHSQAGVDFGAEDGSPADLIFLIAAPEGADDLHVRVLSRLARRLIHEGFRTALREAASPEAVYDVIRKEVQL